MKTLALSEPKPLKAFRDNYLAVVMMVAALFICSAVSAQLDSAKYSRVNGFGFGYKRFVLDSLAMIPLSTSPHIPYRKGGIRYNPGDSTIQVWTGFQWRSIAPGGDGIDTAFVSSDSILTIETPTQTYFLTIPGRNIANASLTANGDYTQNWNRKQLIIDTAKDVRIYSDAPDWNFTNNNHRFLFEHYHSAIGGKPLTLNWALRNVTNTNDSAGGHFQSDLYSTVIDHYGESGSKMARISLDGPNSTIALNTFGTKSSAINIYNDITIEPADTLRMKLKPAASADSIIGVRSYGFGLNALVKFPTPSGGGGATLSNAGSGYRLVKTPSGAIKTLFFGYGTTGDSTTNTDGITVKADTSSTNHIVTQSDLNDTATALRRDNPDGTALYGTIYNATTWANLLAFTNNGATASPSSGKIAISATTPGTLTESLDITGPSCLEYWRATLRVEVNSAQGANTHGVAIGSRSINPISDISIAAYVDLSTDATYGNKLIIKTNYPVDSFLAISTATLSYSNGDILEYTIERIGATFIATARNVTTASSHLSVEYTYPTGYVPSTPPVIPNTGQYSAFALGGDYYIDSLNVVSREIKRAPLMLIGDSKTVGYYGNYSNSIPNMLRANFRNVVTSAGGGDRTAEVLARINEIIALAPKQVLLELGTNNSDTTQFKLDYVDIVDALTNAGIEVYHTAYYQSGNAWRHNWLRATFPSTYIDAHTPTNRTGALTADNVHLSDYGDTLAFNAIIGSDLLKYGQAYQVASRGSLTNTPPLDDVLAEGSTSSLSMNLTGYSTSATKLRLGNLGFQPYDASNAFVLSNAYFDGSNLKYIDNAHVAGFQFAQGQALLAAANTGSAGSNVSIAYPLKVDYTGDVAIGGNISGTLGNFTGAKFIVDGSSGDATFNGVLVQPSHSTNRPSAQFSTLMAQSIADANSLVIENGYFDGSDLRYITTNPISYYQNLSGDIHLGTAVSGTAATVATGVSRLIVKNGGNILIGTSSDNGAKLQVNGTATVTDDAYDATAWNGNNEVPTKNALRDKIESLSGGGITSINSETGSSQTIAAGAGISVNSSSNTHTVSLNTTLDVQYADANNSGTSETDLYSVTTAANTLSTNGNTIHFEASGDIVNDGSTTINLKVYFGGTMFAQSGTITAAGGAWTIRGTIVRSGTNAGRMFADIFIGSSVGKIYGGAALNSSGMDYTTTNILKVTGTAGGANGGSNDITARYWKVTFQP